MFFKPANPVSVAELNKRLLAMAKEQGHDVYYVETMGGEAPRLLYRVHASDGSRELVRGAAFDELDIRSLRSEILAAGNDEIVSTPAIERFASEINNCTRIVVAGSKHEILQERDELREQFWAALDAYVPGSSIRTRASEYAQTFN